MHTMHTFHLSSLYPLYSKGFQGVEGMHQVMHTARIPMHTTGVSPVSVKKTGRPRGWIADACRMETERMRRHPIFMKGGP